ncbi:MAG TPA: hypothetical protein VFD67_03975 [Gemmatimonadaceae bacterium]|nr:hypothetical protein [Gemmatimonadaceae bacterium]
MRTTLPLTGIALVAVALAANAQVSQQANPAAATTLQLTSASAAAKAEFWTALDDWQNFSWPNAQHRFEHALALDSSFGLARVFAANAAAMRGLPLDTVALQRGVMDAARASTAEGAIALAWREKALQHDKPTATLLHAAMDLLPNDPHLASEYVWTLAAVDMKAALDSARAIRTRFPTFGPLSPALSYVLMQTGDTAAAMAEAQRYQQLAPGQPASFVYYGRLLQSLGKYADAEAEYRKSLSFAPRHAMTGYNGITALAEVQVLEGNATAARQTMTEAVQRATSGGDSVQYLQMLAGTQLLLGDQRAAVQSYDAISRVWPTLPDNPGFDLGALYVAAVNAIYGDRRSVAKHLATLHIITPTDTVPFEMSLANVYGYAGQADSTFKYADKLAARAPKNAIAGQVAHFTRGELYLQTRRCDKALEEFRQSDSTWVEIQQGIAECELQLGHRDVGLRWRDRVLARREVNLLDPGELHARMRAAELR